MLNKMSRDLIKHTHQWTFMTILSEQLETIYQEIKTNFSQHRQIRVMPVAGTPPEQYRITYHLQGFCKEDGGEVRPCTNHTILLTLPFGFPHFPPNCKPESPVFHPDFDQEAICIGEFWENNQSLSRLILHIGRMLCGEIYSNTNAFNEEAAAWYKENQQRLPLDTIDQLATTAEPLSAPEESNTSSASLTIESGDDALFADNEIRETEAGEAPEEAEKNLPPHLSLQRPAMAPTSPEPDSDLDGQSQHRLNEARKKHQEGEAYEHQGQPAEALVKYTAVKDLAPDFPEIDKDISRAQYSLDMLGDWAAGDSNKEDAGNNKKGRAAKLKGKQVVPTPKKHPVVQPEKKQSSRRPALAIGCACVGFLLILTCTYLFLNSQWEHALTMVKECKQLLDSKQFPDAAEKCTEALKVNSTILFIKKEEKKLLTAEIRQLQDSIKLAEGVAQSEGGDTSKLQEWQQSMNRADQFLADGRWQEALAGYTRTLQLASEIPTFDHTILDQIRSNRTRAEFNLALQAGEQALVRAEWDAAKNHLDKARELARENPQILSPIISRMQSLRSQVEFHRLMASGDDYFSQGEWTNALAAFSQAQGIEKTFAFADAQTRASLQELITRAEVFSALEQGKKDFAEARWDDAISQYETAIKLLEDNSETLRRDNPVESQQKISRLMLHAGIIRDQQSVASHLKNKELSQAINKMQAIMETTAMSPFAGEEEFLAIINETRLAINQTREDLLLAEQVSYLTANYQKLFIQNNPALTAERLSHPQVTFLKKIGTKRLYRVQCSEEGPGRPVLLQASYLYDPATKKWLFFNNDTTSDEQTPETGARR